MSTKIIKVKFTGGPNQRFSIGSKIYPAGVWKVVTVSELKQLVEVGAKSLFTYQPDDLNFDKLMTKSKTEEKTHGTKKRKKSKKE